MDTWTKAKAYSYMFLIFFLSSQKTLRGNTKTTVFLLFLMRRPQSAFHTQSNRGDTSQQETSFRRPSSRNIVHSQSTLLPRKPTASTPHERTPVEAPLSLFQASQQSIYICDYQGAAKALLKVLKSPLSSSALRHQAGVNLAVICALGGAPTQCGRMLDNLLAEGRDPDGFLAHNKNVLEDALCQAKKLTLDVFRVYLLPGTDTPLLSRGDRKRSVPPPTPCTPTPPLFAKEAIPPDFTYDTHRSPIASGLRFSSTGDLIARTNSTEAYQRGGLKVGQTCLGPEGVQCLRLPGDLANAGTLECEENLRRKDILRSVLEVCRTIKSPRYPLTPGGVLVKTNERTSQSVFITVVLGLSGRISNVNKVEDATWPELVQLGVLESVTETFEEAIQRLHNTQTTDAINTTSKEEPLFHSYLRQFIRHRQPLEITISRADLVADVVSIFLGMGREEDDGGEDIARPLRLKIIGETGVDLGGVTSDVLHSFVSYMTSNHFDADGLPHSTDHASHSLVLFEVLGKVLMKCIVDSRCIGIQCHPFVLHYMHLGMQHPQLPQTQWQWLREVGPGIASGLRMLMRNTDALPPLVPGVGGDDVEEIRYYEGYVEDICRYKMLTSRLPQLEALHRGFHNCGGIEPCWMQHLPDIVDLLCGRISADDVIRNLEFRGWESSDSTPYFLCCALRKMTSRELSKFLQLTTSLPTIPVRGFPKRISVFRAKPGQALFARTCFLQLECPAFESLEELQGCMSAALVALEGGMKELVDDAGGDEVEE